MTDATAITASTQPARHMALAYAALEGKEWSAATGHCEAALAAGMPAARELLAVIRHAQGDFDAALRLLETARARGEMSADGAARLIRLHLLAGEPRLGWQLLGECCRNHVFGPPLYDAPRWQGELLRGRRIAVWGGGLGDEIFYVRYLPRLCDQGAEVYLNCRAPLVELFRGLRGNIKVLRYDQAPPAVDFQMNTAELPLHFGAATGETWPEGPYLTATPVALPPGGVRVGVVWAADSRHLEAQERTATLAEMASLAQVPGVSLFNLQVGRTAAQLFPSPGGMRVLPLSVGFPTFAGQAAQILGLDLVISVDTALANLAGALGARVWVAVPRLPDWRWGLEGPATLWYPTARIYRQPAPGDWASVFSAMARDLAAGDFLK